MSFSSLDAYSVQGASVANRLPADTPRRHECGCCYRVERADAVYAEARLEYRAFAKLFLAAEYSSPVVIQSSQRLLRRLMGCTANRRTARRSMVQWQHEREGVGFDSVAARSGPWREAESIPRRQLTGNSASRCGGVSRASALQRFRSFVKRV